ncbi:MAG: hypothetical protein JSR39_08650 [Verrucomicrobia bacterium]|nr:hypothetical protein [Verrucomicrobiota bacterium]
MRTIYSLLLVAALSFFNLTFASFGDRDIANPKNERASLPYILYPDTKNKEELLDQFLRKQEENIIALTKEIDLANCVNQQEVFHLLNKRGLAYFFIGQLEKAIEDFTFVIGNIQPEQIEESSQLGTALWGRMLCYAFSDKYENTYEDACAISALFCPCNKNHERGNAKMVTSFNQQNERNVLPVAKFAYPEERVSIRECHERTTIIAEKMRSLAELIPSYAIRKTVNWLIDDQALKAHNCCKNGNHWTECLGPIADVWKKLENTWDQLVDLFNKGINLDIFLTTPLNL